MPMLLRCCQPAVQSGGRTHPHVRIAELRAYMEEVQGLLYRCSNCCTCAGLL
jgi:hypothetical protein